MDREKQKAFVSAVIYVRNAEDRIGSFLASVIKTLECNFESCEIICVNDASEDESLKAIREAGRAASSAIISVVNMSGFHGLELAMNAGVDLAIGDFVFEFDSTRMDYSADEIMNAYRKSLQGYDIVSASPDTKESFASRLFYRVFDAYSNLHYKMHTESFRVASRRAINRIGDANKVVPYRKPLYAASGLSSSRIVYKPQINQAPPPAITSNAKRHALAQERRYRAQLAVDSLILFTSIGYKFSISLTLLMCLASVAMLAYSAITYMMAQPVAGWTTTILFLSFAFFGLFGILTVVIKYLQLLVNLSFKRKQYCFESIEKLAK